MHNTQQDRRDSVRILQHEVDWNNLPRSTLRQLGDNVDDMLDGYSAADNIIAACFRFTMRQAGQLGTRYANPQFSVVAPSPNNFFIHEARRAQRAWLKTLKSVLGTSGCLRREMKKRLPEIRQLEFTGVMVINGMHVHPKQWPESVPTSAGANLVGQQFGRLTVIQRVPGARWLCNCSCGGHNTVRTKHLLHGAIRSCGCLKAEAESKQRFRKACRTGIA